MTPGSAPDFRAAWGRLVGLLTRGHRLADPSLAEDAVQHAMLQALRLWPTAGEPAEPMAWLTTVARHHLLDSLRSRARECSWSGDEQDQAQANALPGPNNVSTLALPGELNDDELALLLACCDPALPPASQVALALKLVCGFSLREIAAGLLCDEAAVAQRLARARRVLAARGHAVELPSGAALPPRRQAALHAVALLFNEGYVASSGDVAQRHDLCREAMRLARALAANPHTAHPDADALAALLLLQGARLHERVDAQGDWLLLAEQDRSQWNTTLLAAGLAHLQRAMHATELSAWHLLAGIAAEHATATSAAQTRWDRIVPLYDTLLRLDPAAPTRLAHAVALAQRDGPDAGLALLHPLLAELPPMLKPYGLAAQAEMLRQQGYAGPARAALLQAVQLAQPAAAQRLLMRKLAALG